MENANMKSQGARGDASPRRYVGRSGSTGTSKPLHSRGPLGPAAVKAAPRAAAPASVAPSNTVAARLMPWSARLIVAVSLISVLAVAWRMPGAFTPPVDSPGGVEATHAAFANLLSGRTGGALDPVRLWPPPAPWHGYAPANPASGLPLYGWITAGLMTYLGAGDWSGRAVAVVFSLFASISLFSLVRRAAGARAALYSLLFFAISPLSALLGQQFSPASLLLATQAWAVLTLAQWRGTVTVLRPRGSTFAFARAIVASVGAALIDPGALFLLPVAAYLLLAPGTTIPDPVFSRSPRAAVVSWRDAWDRSPNRGRLVGYGGALMGAAALWMLLTSGFDGALVLGVGDGGGGISTLVPALFSGSTYVQIVGTTIERVLTFVGLLLLLAGVLRGARPPLQLVFHGWLAGALLHVLADAGRLPRHEDVLLPLILPVCSLVGVGAAWAGSLP
ncbi:MAG: glycosyltransferase family 39 protein, partial [Chloroflexota bacterium]|nr:glycosyltransferase family 39 protein [Chloroflexota bacterium]